MQDLIAIGLTLGAVATGIGLFCLFPGGAAVVAGILNSRIGQGAIAAGAALLAVLTIRGRAYREGESAAKRMVEEANAEAANRRREVERTVAGESDDALRGKLRGYRR